MSLQALGRGLYRGWTALHDAGASLANLYQTNERFRTIVNTVGIYGTLNVAGNIAEKLTGARGLDGMSDMAAAIISAGYLNRHVDRITNSRLLQNILRVATTAGAVADVGHEIHELPPHAFGVDLGDTVKRSYETLHNTIGRHVQDLRGKPLTTDALLGGTGSVVYQIGEGVAEARRTARRE